MYPWIWRHLPGPTAVRALTATFLILAIVVVLFLWVFPALEAVIEYDSSQVPRTQRSAEATP
jgi:hypothetical protein